jgi:hypothetical protein
MCGGFGMFSLGKKLSSVMLCGSMAVTLLGNSGVHAANELTEDVEYEFEEEDTAVDEHDDKVENDDEGNENDDEGNENTELDTVETSQDAVKNDGVPAQNPAERSGSSFAANVAKGLGTVALGVGMGVGADEGVRRFKSEGSSKESVLKIQNEELRKKIEEDVLGNLKYGAIGLTGLIPKLRDMVSSWLGRDIDVKSKAAMTGMIISHTIGMALFLWNLIKLFDSTTRPKTKKGLAYTAVMMSADLALPPAGFILQCCESILNVVFGKKASSVDKAIALTKNFSLADIKKLAEANVNVKKGTSNQLQQADV